jgi:hypothetical protein
MYMTFLYCIIMYIHEYRDIQKVYCAGVKNVIYIWRYYLHMTVTDIHVNMMVRCQRTVLYFVYNTLNLHKKAKNVYTFNMEFYLELFIVFKSDCKNKYKNDWNEVLNSWDMVILRYWKVQINAYYVRILPN